MKFKKNPARVTQGMDERDDRDELIEALADNVVADPENVHSVSVAEVENPETSDFEIEVTFRNQVGRTCTVDGILEQMNMRDWRVFCDRFLVKALDATGHDAELYDWPTPRPEVTKVPEDGGTDVIASVRVKWRIDVETWHDVKAFVEEKAGKSAEEVYEETCIRCDSQIRYKARRGANVATCPVCGAVTPLCNECTRPEHERNACDRCRVHILCRRMNEHMAEWR